MISKDALENVLNDVLQLNVLIPMYELEREKNAFTVRDSRNHQKNITFEMTEDGLVKNIMFRSGEASSIIGKMKKIMNADDVAELNRLTEMY